MTPKAYAHMGTATHPDHDGESLPVYGTTLGPNRIAQYTVQTPDGRVLATASIPGLRDLGYLVTWDLRYTPPDGGIDPAA